MTFKEKEQRYAAAGLLLKVTSYMTDEELHLVEKIGSRCMERWKDTRKQGQLQFEWAKYK